MPIDPHNFWGTESWDKFPNPPLTEALVGQAERKLGVRLPLEYVALLRLRNGGPTQGFAFPTSQPTPWAEDHVPLDDINGIGGPDARPGDPNILDRDVIVEVCGLLPSQVPLSGDGHYYITLDYRKGPSPSVTWWDLELGEELHLSDSFAEFLEGLRPIAEFDPDDDDDKNPSA
jgi:SMI1 / KNR4 family (SUKH-1)